MTFIKVDTVSNENGMSDEIVTILVALGPGMSISPFRVRGSSKDRCKLSFADGRAIMLDHSFKYMENLIMGEGGRPGLTSDIDRQLAATSKQ